MGRRLPHLRRLNAELAGIGLTASADDDGWISYARIMRGYCPCCGQPLGPSARA